MKTQSQVTKIVIDQPSSRAFGVEYVEEGSRTVKRVFARKEVIISAGAFGSPKLLMMSGIGPADELRKTGIPLVKDLSVGKNLQEHIATSFITLKLDNSSVSFESIKSKENDLSDWYHNKSGPFRSSGLWGFVQFAQSSFEKRPGVPDIQVHYINSVDDTPKAGKKTHYNAFSYYNQISVFPTIIAPKSRGWLKLNKTDPIFSKPLVYPNFFSHPNDIRVMKEGINISRQLFKSGVFNNSAFHTVQTPAPKCKHLQHDEDKYNECICRNYFIPLYHPAGTCKMGPKSDQNAVVDPELRVYGLTSLRVIDASIIPTIPRGNINAPTIMIAEKGSDLIKKDWLGTLH